MTKKVLIVSVPKQDVIRPPGILSILAGCCEQSDCDYEILDLNLLMFKTLERTDALEIDSDFYVNRFRSKKHQDLYLSICAHLQDKIEKYQPNLIAISVFTECSILATHSLLEYLANFNSRKNYEIVLGGHGVDGCFEPICNNLKFGHYCLKNNLVENVIFGEGELAFIELLKGNKDFPGINNNIKEQILDLDSLPLPSYKKIKPLKYFYSNQPELLVTGSRGCVRSCSFCSVGSKWEKYVYKSGRKIAEEIYTIWKQTGVKKYDFSDSLINGSIKSFREFNQRLIELKQENSKFDIKYKGQFICRPRNQLKEKDYYEMSIAGAETLVVGVEHFSNKIRDHMRKKFDDDAIDFHFEMCGKYQIKNVLLLLSGYVTETLEDHQTNLKGLVKYQKYALARIIYAINVNVNGLEILPQTPLSDMIEELDIQYLGEESRVDWISMNNPTLDRKERLRRSAEIIYSAGKLGYKILHFDLKLEELKRRYSSIQSNMNKLIPISVDNPDKFAI